MRVLVLGTNGVTGRALAAEFAMAGWDVVGTERDRTHFPVELRDCGFEFVQSDRYDADQLARVFTRGADAVVNCLCYAAEHGRELLGYADSYASAIVLSSKAVYVDDRGRHSNSNDPPRFDGQVREDQAVLAPDYSGVRQPRGPRVEQGCRRNNSAGIWAADLDPAALEHPRPGERPQPTAHAIKAWCSRSIRKWVESFCSGSAGLMNCDHFVIWDRAVRGCFSGSAVGGRR